MRTPVVCRRRFEPIGDIGDVVLLLNGSEGAVATSPFRQIAFIEGIISLGHHGLIPIWCHGAAPPLPYALDTNGIPNFPIPAAAGAGGGGSTAKITPAALAFGNTNTSDLAQVRFRVRPIGLTGPAPQDIDVDVFHPAGAQRWILSAASGVGGTLNMMQQAPDPGDANQAPAQGGALALPGAWVGFDPWEAAAFTELFIAGSQGPAFVVNNRGNAVTTGGAVAIEAAAIRYVMNVIQQDGDTEEFLGSNLTKPKGIEIADCIRVPVAGSTR